VSANSGSTTSGNTYSFGTGTETERALGAINSSGPGNIAYSLVLTRGAGQRPVTGVNIAYTGEQWRNSAATAQAITFSWSTFTTAPTTIAELGPAATGFNALPALNFTSPITGGTAAALNGNLAANRTALGATLTGLNLTSSNFLALRWVDIDHSGVDHGLALDDLSVSIASVANATPTAAALTTSIDVVDQPFVVNLATLISDLDLSEAWGETITFSGSGDSGFSLADNLLTLSGQGVGTYTFSFAATDSQGALSNSATVSITVIPTPGASLALVLGGAVVSRRRRR
jgi:hypothetical protein